MTAKAPISLDTTIINAATVAVRDIQTFLSADAPQIARFVAFAAGQKELASLVGSHSASLGQFGSVSTTVSQDDKSGEIQTIFNSADRQVNAVNSFTYGPGSTSNLGKDFSDSSILTVAGIPTNIYGAGATAFTFYQH
jgi:hypothetical protein